MCKIQRILIFDPTTTFDPSTIHSTLGVRRTTQASKMTLALATSSTSHRRAGASAGYIRHVHCACSLSSGRFHVPSKGTHKCQMSAFPRRRHLHPVVAPCEASVSFRGAAVVPPHQGGSGSEDASPMVRSSQMTFAVLVLGVEGEQPKLAISCSNEHHTYLVKRTGARADPACIRSGP